MKSHKLLFLIPLSAIICVAASGVDRFPADELTLERLAALEGTWVQVDDSGQPTDQVVYQYRSIANGQTVIETLFPGTDHEMVSVYHQDGDQLVMTHYCMLANQPKFKALPGKTSDQIIWEFAGGTNLDPESDMHVHKVVMNFIGDNRMKTTCDFWNGGKLQETKTFEVVRQK